MSSFEADIARETARLEADEPVGKKPADKASDREKDLWDAYPLDSIVVWLWCDNDEDHRDLMQVRLPPAGLIARATARARDTVARIDGWSGHPPAASAAPAYADNIMTA